MYDRAQLRHDNTLSLELAHIFGHAHAALLGLGLFGLQSYAWRRRNRRARAVARVVARGAHRLLIAAAVVVVWRLGLGLIGT